MVSSRRRGVGLVVALHEAGGNCAEPLKRHVALVLAKEVEKPLVVLRWHVEGRDEQLVVAARVLETEADDFSEVMSGEIAGHEWLIDHRPEGLLRVEDPIEEHFVRGGNDLPWRCIGTGTGGRGD